jgi:hypothetical protein
MFGDSFELSIPAHGAINLRGIVSESQLAEIVHQSAMIRQIQVHFDQKRSD